MRSNLALLAFASLSQAAASTKTTRVDDVLVLKGNSLVFDPVGGLNESTRDAKWQALYLQKMDYTKLDEAYHAHQAATDENARQEGDISKRDGSLCIACMVTKLAAGQAGNRSIAFALCAQECATVTVTTLKKTLVRYWVQAGIGEYAVGNFAYDTWKRFGW